MDFTPVFFDVKQKMLEVLITFQSLNFTSTVEKNGINLWIKLWKNQEVIALGNLENRRDFRQTKLSVQNFGNLISKNL